MQACAKAARRSDTGGTRNGVVAGIREAIVEFILEKLDQERAHWQREIESLQRQVDGLVRELDLVHRQLRQSS